MILSQFLLKEVLDALIDFTVVLLVDVAIFQLLPITIY